MQTTGKRIKASFNGILVPLLLLTAGSHAPVARAQSPGTFTPTGNLTSQRMYHTATLLTNGKVLIAGGWAIASNRQVWASAELYARPRELSPPPAT